MLYYYQPDGCTYRDLAGLLGVSAATINARLTKARQMLRSRMMSESESHSASGSAQRGESQSERA